MDIPCPCSSAIFLLVASGIGGRLVRLPCALARAMPALTRSPMSALSNWARLAIMPNTSSPCGVRQAGTTVRVSLAKSGGDASGGSHVTSLSPDGRYVVFESDASDLVPGDTHAVLACLEGPHAASAL